MVTKNKISVDEQKIGQIFTPSYVADFMVHNIRKFNQKRDKSHHSLQVLEPSVGGGVFLDSLLKQGYSNITAYEMDSSLKDTLLTSYPTVNLKFENFLSSNPLEKFDLIIGNPPYLGQNYNSAIFQEYVELYPTCAKYFVGNMDLFYFFIHLGIEKLNPGGILTYITTNYWITKSEKTGIRLLKPHILDECYLLQYIDLSQLTLFQGAQGQHNCIFVLQRKTIQEKAGEKNKPIEIIQIHGNQNPPLKEELYNQKIFNDLHRPGSSQNIRRYTSVLTNHDLQPDKNWNIIFPQEVKDIVDAIEKYCESNGKVSSLGDYFRIRNGLILIKDSIFILKENWNLKIKDDDFFVKIGEAFVILDEIEKKRLKKIYKSKSINSYGYKDEDYIGYLISFNKNEFNTTSLHNRNQMLKEKYPNLTGYLHQFKGELQRILINAKENPADIYFPRRGAHIRRFEKISDEDLVDLEQLYDSHEKIFFKFITEENTFGYSNQPYYATSDTYFLWPKSPNIDYMFLLAYLNSKIVTFLYKAKNITIKRSKTKLERGLPIPNMELFKTEEERGIIDQIRSNTLSLTNRLRNPNDKISTKNAIDTLFFKLFNLDQDQLYNLLREYYSFQLN
ncbi:MAG: Eco57I restriction-modification methylase domain-containing protein [Promethearchaeota archaeon]